MSGGAVAYYCDECLVVLLQSDKAKISIDILCLVNAQGLIDAV